MNSFRIRPDGSFVGRLPANWLKRSQAFVEHETPDPWTAIELGWEVWKALPERDRLEGRLRAPTRLVVELDGKQDLGHLPWEALGLGRERPVALSAWQIVRRFEVEGRVARTRRTPRRALVLVGDVLKGREDLSRTLVPDTRDAVACVVRELRLTGLEVRVAIASRALDARLMEDADFDCDVELRESADLERLFDDAEGFDLIHAHAVGIEEGSSILQAANHLQLGLEGKHAHLPIVPVDGLDSRRSLRGLLEKHPTRLIVLCACRTTEQLAPALLQVADHVVGMRGYVNPQTLEAWCPAFYGAVRGAASIGEAVRRGRVALMELDARHAAQERLIQWWIPAHYAATDDDKPFAEPWEVALDRYQRRELDESRPFRGPFEALGKTLDQVAVPLLVEPVPGGERRDAQAIWEERRRGQQTLRTLVEAGEHPRLLVLGEAGSGKTTTLRQVQRVWMGEGHPLVAVHASLAALARSKRKPTAEGFVRFLWRKEQGWRDLLDALDRLHRAGRLVLLLDGLDEVPQEHSGRLAQFLSALRERWPNARTVVAGRPSAGHLDGFVEAELLPLDETKQRELLENLFDALGIPEAFERAEAHASELQTAEGSLAELARIPLFLVLIGRLLATGQALPSGLRHRFLEDMLDDLLSGKHQIGVDAKRSVPEPVDTSKGMLAELALAMTRKGVLSLPEKKLQALATKRFGPTVPAITNAASVGIWLGLVQDGTGILQHCPQGRTFWHRSFQEVLTAIALIAEARDDEGEVDLPKLIALTRKEFEGPDEEARERAARFWREPLALATGFLGEEGLASPWIDALLSDPATRATALVAVPLADSLAPEVIERVLTAFDHWKEAQPVYAALSERFGQGSRVVSLLEDRGIELAGWMPTELSFKRVSRIELHFLVECLLAIEERGLDSGASEALSRILDEIGTPDPVKLGAAFSTVPGKPNSELWADVTGGTFLMGSPETEEGRHDDETQAKVTVSDFRIARTPVTLGQYWLFDRCKAQRWGVYPLLPAAEITHFEATLFCRWLDHHGASLKPPNRRDWTFQLPTEAQWEYACRDGGQAMTRFVNGDSDEALKRVAFFGKDMFEGPEPVASRDPSSRLVLWDMHGNVWEWCRDWYHERLREGVDLGGPQAGAMRVQRGGSFMDVSEVCRSAYRNRNPSHPADGRGKEGFRVVLAPRAPRR